MKGFAMSTSTSTCIALVAVALVGCGSEEVLEGRSILGLYPATDEQAVADFAKWRQRVGR